MDKYIDLVSYAPRKCKHFCCGDCCISGRSCDTDYPECKAAEPKEIAEILKG